MENASRKRYAVVTGSNKGIGFGTVKELASNGIVVVLTARDEKRGLEAVEKLAEAGLSQLVIFHQLDVTDPSSISALADFVKTKFGKLDILINNAGVPAGKLNPEAFKAAQIEKFIPGEWVKGVLSDVENLTEDKIDQMLNEFTKDYKEDSLESKGWPTSFSSYIVSKACLNAYTRIMAKKYPNFCINCVSPGYVKTDINCNAGVLTVEEGAQSVVSLALLPNAGPNGLFFNRHEVIPF
ncbi:(-)-isopiperitenone reductase-like isoform X2 [Cannabis sativa]|uniref:(-)-isopiperitenone reductase-like isoform X2 n=1 Tax=Cannabis sativa TaxID=3483 RepID=UPI0029CA473F|nr:(-)-isopiperitenone reductase-like isoform X2 [Cannabis sativa]